MMYHKFIGDREVFSTCKSIQTNEGVWISNPTEEQIADAGWLPYVPPVVPPAPELEPDLTAEMEAIKRMFATQTEELSDEDALEVAALYPTWYSKIGTEVKVGERLWYNGKLYKVIQAHTEQENWTPDATPALYTEVSVVEWPEWVQPIGASDAYMKGDHTAHNDKHWESEVDNNVWEPGVYGWREV